MGGGCQIQRGSHMRYGFRKRESFFLYPRMSKMSTKKRGDFLPGYKVLGVKIPPKSTKSPRKSGAPTPVTAQAHD